MRLPAVRAPLLARAYQTAAAAEAPPLCAPGIQPVDPAEPLVPVGRVPGDRARDPVLPGDLRRPAGLPFEFVVTDAQRPHLARTGPVPLLRRLDVAAGGPEAALLADTQDQRDPVGHRDVLALAVDVDLAGHAARGDGEVAADAVGAEAEVPQR